MWLVALLFKHGHGHIGGRSQTSLLGKMFINKTRGRSWSSIRRSVLISLVAVAVFTWLKFSRLSYGESRFIVGAFLTIFSHFHLWINDAIRLANRFTPQKPNKLYADQLRFVPIFILFFLTNSYITNKRSTDYIHHTYSIYNFYHLHQFYFRLSMAWVFP